MRVRNQQDGAVHFSDLKEMALSPAHYMAQCHRPKPPTRAMRIGTAGHYFTFGPRKVGKQLSFYPGKIRSGKAWDDFELANADKEILTAPEADEGRFLAGILKNDPEFIKLMNESHCMTEVPCEWLDGDMECATSGLDIVTDWTLADVKFVSTANPEPLISQCWKMFYHTQLAFYRAGALANGWKPKRIMLFCVETKDPYPVTPLVLDTEVLERGEMQFRLWLETLRACESQESFPPYTQTPLTFGIPHWARTQFDLEEEEEAAL